MTITYSSEVANGSSFGCFWRILCKWRGSVYKLIWRELLAFLTLYFTINLVYRLALNDEQKRLFERLRIYFKSHSENIPMSFVLGFYVTLVVGRWWQQYKLLPWPDTLALFVSAAIPGADEKGRLMRRNIVRYAILAYVITLQRVSLRVKKRFPGWQHMVDAGIMMESEKKIFDLMDEKNKAMSKYWMPLVWATNIINRARKESLISSDHLVQTILTELSDVRRRLGSLIGFDTVCVPLVYTQVVTLSVYSYFISALMGRQFLPDDVPTKGKSEDPDFYFPLFTCLQFVFYVGWLKVAEVLINPFGEDDDDIELNWLIDRHIKAAYMIVDQMHEEYPELLKDQYWEEVVPKDLPYTVASECYRRTEPKGSADHYKVKDNEAIYLNLQSSRKMTHSDDVYGDHPDLDYETVDTPMVGRKNWFQRQMHRMGSMRSTSTGYSSGRLFSRARHNSVYSSPESGLPLPTSAPHSNNPHHNHNNNNNNNINNGGASGIQSQKMSLYDRLIGRKSSRGPQRRGSKVSGSAIPVTLRNRPRIPTPDVTKEVMAQEQRMISNPLPPSATAISMMHHQEQHYQPPGYAEMAPFVQVLLSPIQETEVSPALMAAAPPGTAALAQAVLSPALKTAGLSPTSVTLSTVTGQSLLTPYLIGTPADSPVPNRATFAISPILRKQTPPQTILSLNSGSIPAISSNEVSPVIEDEVSHGSNASSIASQSSTSTVSTLAMTDDPTRKISVNSQSTLAMTDDPSRTISVNSQSSKTDNKEVYV